MPKMTAADAAVAILRREGVSCVFGLPGAAINPSGRGRTWPAGGLAALREQLRLSGHLQKPTNCIRIEKTKFRYTRWTGST